MYFNQHCSHLDRLWQQIVTVKGSGSLLNLSIWQACEIENTCTTYRHWIQWEGKGKRNRRTQYKTSILAVLPFIECAQYVCYCSCASNVFVVIIWQYYYWENIAHTNTSSKTKLKKWLRNIFDIFHIFKIVITWMEMEKFWENFITPFVPAFISLLTFIFAFIAFSFSSNFMITKHK